MLTYITVHLAGQASAISKRYLLGDEPVSDGIFTKREFLLISQQIIGRAVMNGFWTARSSRLKGLHEALRNQVCKHVCRSLRLTRTKSRSYKNNFAGAVNCFAMKDLCHADILTVLMKNPAIKDYQ